jgi:hypothetical protein
MIPSIKIENVDLEIKEFNLPIEMNLISDFTKDKDFKILDLKNVDLHTLDNLDYNEIKIINFLLEWGLVNNLEKALEKYEEIYMYENATMLDVAHYVVEEYYGDSINSLHSLIANNIDYEGVAHDLQQGGDYYELGSDIFEYHY